MDDQPLWLQTKIQKKHWANYSSQRESTATGAQLGMDGGWTLNIFSLSFASLGVFQKM
jgi:hypothetical protein